MGLLGSFVNAQACVCSVSQITEGQKLLEGKDGGQYDDHILPASFYQMKTCPSVHGLYMGFTVQSLMDLSDPEEHILPTMSPPPKGLTAVTLPGDAK